MCSLTWVCFSAGRYGKSWRIKQYTHILSKVSWVFLPIYYPLSFSILSPFSLPFYILTYNSPLPLQTSPATTFQTIFSSPLLPCSLLHNLFYFSFPTYITSHPYYTCAEGVHFNIKHKRQYFILAVSPLLWQQKGNSVYELTITPCTMNTER